MPPPEMVSIPLRGPLLLTLFALALGCATPTPPEKTGNPAGDETARTGGAAYVGAAACATCHTDLARSYSRSGMGRAFYPMTGPQAGSYARFPDTIEVSDSVHYTMFEESGRFFQRQFQLDPSGAEINVDTREMHYVLGSGNHSRSFITVQDGRLFQMPICWYPEGDVWDFCPGYEYRNLHFAREIDDTCIFCHNGRTVRTGEYNNLFQEPLPHGIGCERCHGPGSLHVQKWRTPSQEDLAHLEEESWQGDETIVNPARLEDSLGMQVCMQCHLGDSSHTARVMLDRDRITDYRPGLPISDFWGVYTYRQSLPGMFGLSSQVERLQLSRCFTEAKGGMECTTCHDPHQEVYELSATEPDHFNQACLGCHSLEACTREEHGGSQDCVSCHMRRAEPHDQRYTTFLDHWIRRNPGQGLEQARDDYTLVSFFGGDLSRDPERSLGLGRAYLNHKVRTEEGTRMPWDLVTESLQEAVEIAPDEAGPHFFLGRAAMNRRLWREAEEHFRNALRIDPQDVRAVQELGSALYQQGKLDEAAETLQRSLTMGPRGDDEASVLNEIARVEMERKRYDEARRYLEEALEQQPFSHEILANLGLLESLEGNRSEAVTWLKEALRYSPGHPAIERYLQRIEPGR